MSLSRKLLLGPRALVLYLSLFLILVPGVSRGGMTASRESSGRDVPAAAGLPRFPVLAGSGVQYPDQDVSSELAIVFLILGGAVGLAAWAATSANHH
ncbi:MAG TPA: hypothetical protein PK636_01985 [bacterium]|nr:hypothetical protein [bacterium]